MTGIALLRFYDYLKFDTFFCLKNVPPSRLNFVIRNENFIDEPIFLFRHNDSNPDVLKKTQCMRWKMLMTFCSISNPLQHFFQIMRKWKYNLRFFTYLLVSSPTTKRRFSDNIRLSLGFDHLLLHFFVKHGFFFQTEKISSRFQESILQENIGYYLIDRFGRSPVVLA